MASLESPATPEGVFSLLDTDLYKLTMQCAVRKYYPDVPVTYHLNNRTAHMKLSKEAFAWLEVQISKLANIALSQEELSFLQKTCGYLDHGDYLTSFLPKFRFDPASQVDLKFHDDPERPGFGDIELDVKGSWQDTILYEIPLLALVSESYFKFVDTDWNYDGQEEAAYEKGKKLIQGGAIFSEFGTRRRRDYGTHERVLAGLVRANRELTEDSSKEKGDVISAATDKISTAASNIASATLPGTSDAEAPRETKPGKLSGTSNVHFAMKYGVSPVGTMAHEWFMGIAAATQDYRGATARALSQWIECFGRGTLGIALTDTFGTPAFLSSFRSPLPESMRGLTEGWLRNPPSFADVFAGTRQDSGDPRRFIATMSAFYRQQGVPTDSKTIVFSDSLTVDSALTYKCLAEKKGFAPSFGIGTFLTNDFVSISTGEKSKPLNIVIKISSAGGYAAVKLSDDLGKNTGDSRTVDRVKEQLGYVDSHWNEADEADRYGKGVIGDDLSDNKEDT